MPAPWILVVGAVIGFVLGPSLHHLGLRAAYRRPFGGLRPRCEACDAAQPLNAWFARTCSSCGASRRRLEPLVWLASAAGMAGATWLTGSTWLFPAHVWFVIVTVILVVTDFEEKLIPNRVLYPGTVIAAALLAVGATAEGRVGDLGRAGLAAAGYFAVLFVVALVARGGFGMGDVKLAVLLGLFLGFWGLRVLATGVFLTGILGGLPAIVLLVTGRASRGHELPYGPAMVFGSWLALMVGENGLF